jgi:hypothetical protein
MRTDNRDLVVTARQRTIWRVCGRLIVGSGSVLCLAGLVLLPAWYGIVLTACGVLGAFSGALILFGERRLPAPIPKADCTFHEIRD